MEHHLKTTILEGKAFGTRCQERERGASSHTSGLWKDCCAVRARLASSADGLSRALKSRRIITHPKQRLPRCPAAAIDRRTVRLRTRSPLLWAYVHLEWDVDLTHRLVDSAWLRGSFEAVCEQVRAQRK
jgi:hypothetical protein